MKQTAEDGQLKILDCRFWIEDLGWDDILIIFDIEEQFKFADSSLKCNFEG